MSKSSSGDGSDRTDDSLNLKQDSEQSSLDGANGLSRRKLLGSLGGLGLAIPLLSACGAKTEDTAPAVSEAPAGPLDMGMVIDRDDSNYESWRGQLAWHNFVSNRLPATIVRPHTYEQVVAAVNFARENGLKVSVKSGGHNYYESWMRDDCLLLDMYNFRNVEVDEASETAWVGPSVWSYNLLNALKPYNLAFPVATCLSVGMGGYVMGGGIGYGWQEWGMACHNIVAAEVVTADGEIVTATADQHSDLYWAARGGVAGFPGVVLRWKLQCHKDRSNLQLTAKMFPVSRMSEVIDACQVEVLKGVPGVHTHVVVLPTMMAKAAFLTPEVAATVDIKESYVCLAEMYVMNDSAEQIQPITDARFTAPIFAEAAATSVHKGNNGLISVFQELKGREITYTNQICNAVWTDKPRESMEAIVEPLTNAGADLAYVAIVMNGKNMHRDDAAFSMAKTGSSSLSCYGVWFSDKEKETAEWAETISKGLAPYAEGRYINETDCFRRPDEVKLAYTPENWEKLHVVNEKYDPNKLFHTFPGFERS